MPKQFADPASNAFSPRHPQKPLLKRRGIYADVVELVDTPDLGSGAARRGGSSPFIRTIILGPLGH